MTTMTALAAEPAAPVVKVTLRGLQCPWHPTSLLNLGSRFHYCRDASGDHKVLASQAETDLLGGAL